MEKGGGGGGGGREIFARKVGGKAKWEGDCVEHFNSFDSIDSYNCCINYSCK